MRALGIVALATACGIGSTRLVSPPHPDTATDTGTTTTSAGLVRNDAAIRALRNARCDRAFSCAEIGPKRRFSTMDACMDESELEARALFGAEACPVGLLDTSLSQCLGDLADDDCELPLEAIDRNRSCRRAKLCP